MPATSKAQQRLFGLAYAIKKGDMKRSDADAKAVEIADSMSLADLKKFAETDHKGLPDKVKENISPGNIGGMGGMAFPSNFDGAADGSGDVPAGKGDAKKEYKKKKKKREAELKKKKNEAMIYTNFTQFLTEAKIRDARKDLGYVAFLEEMAELNSRDLQKAYDDALDVLQDKGMSEKEAIGFLNSPHGKYMAEYLIPGQDYSVEAFLDKLEEYYNERMLKQYAKDYKGLAK
tara:strand:- start:212 stop:907 length:696 start_codon:yes stop_codon:yes gene_type:complete